MKLIFEYYWGSEACCGTEVFPVEYSSKDDLLLDFQIACEKAMETSTKVEFFVGRELHPTDFMHRVLVKEGKKSGKQECEWKYHGPTIYTLEEWFVGASLITFTKEDVRQHS
jgi:hypothetical protein